MWSHYVWNTQRPKEMSLYGIMKSIKYVYYYILDSFVIEIYKNRNNCYSEHQLNWNEQGYSEKH